MKKADEKPLAVVLVSGGMDSATALGISASEGNRIALIHFDYGQRNRIRERTAFDALAEHFNAERTLIVPMDFLKIIGGSALTDENIPVPEEMPAKGEIPATYVPFRNGIMLAVAAAWAEVIGASKIFTGFVEEDSSGYPDCREVFVNAMEKAINLGRRPEGKVEIIAPLLHKTKAEIVSIGTKLKIPYELTWSCYLGGEYHCGKCPACRLRKKAFIEARIKDPTIYEPQ
ncbi:7-cyano-7-deazaguanine synthase QueC [bacterium]|nr:7-cyano-7-deazaguanine synthase QueC [bacterium]